MKQPTFPPEPAGTNEIVGYQDIYAEVPTPVVSLTRIIPQVTIENQRVVVGQQPQVSSKPPTTEAVAAWKAETNRLNEDYQGELQDKIAEIQTRRQKNLRDGIQAWVGILTGSIACLISLAGLLLAIRKERRESVPQSAKLIIP